jgi:hypothetical protein
MQRSGSGIEREPKQSILRAKSLWILGPQRLTLGVLAMTVAAADQDVDT